MEPSALPVIPPNPTRLEKYNALVQKYRFYFLGVVTFVEFGRFYCQELPSALQAEMVDLYKIDDGEYNFFQSLYNVPNIVSPFLVGLTLDMLGRPFGLALCMAILAVGQALFATSAHISVRLFWLACAARTLVGMGCKNISVAKTTYTADWFRDSELSFALSLGVGVSRLGVVAVMFLASRTYEISAHSLAYAFWMGELFVMLSNVCGIVVMLLDQYVLLESKYDGRKDRAKKPTRFSDILHFGPGLWLLFFSIFFFHMSFNCFINNCVKLARERFGYTREQAGDLSGNSQLITVFLCPILGWFVDKLGLRPISLLIGCGCNVVAQFYLALSPDKVTWTIGIYGSYCLVGVAYCFYMAVSFPTIVFLAEPQIMGTAMGTAYSFQALGVTLGSLILGKIVKECKYIFYANAFLGGAAALSGMFALLLCIYDCTHGKILLSVNAGERQKLALKAAAERQRLLQGHGEYRAEEEKLAPIN